MTWTNDWVGYGVLYLQYACSCVFRGYLPRVGARHRHRRNTSPIVGGNDSSMVLVRRVDFRASVSVSLSSVHTVRVRAQSWREARPPITRSGTLDTCRIRHGGGFWHGGRPDAWCGDTRTEDGCDRLRKEGKEGA